MPAEPIEAAEAAAPHYLLERYLADHLGRRADLFGELADDLFIPLIRALSDQLSVYCDVRPYAVFGVRDLTIREGATRSYVLVALTDRGAALRLQAVFEHWDIPSANTPAEFVSLVNGRRWRFIDHHLAQFVAPLLERIATSLAAFYVRKPHAQPKAGLIRLCEGVDATWLVLEVDLREPEQLERDTPGRYLVQ
jgi:hypothetical protein